MKNIKEKSKKTLKTVKKILTRKTEKELFIEESRKFINENFSDEYNQLNFIEYLTDDELQIYLEISNRTDGKTYGTFLWSLYFSTINENVRISFLVRHFELKRSIKENIIEIFSENPDYFDLDLLSFIDVDDYTKVYYKNDCIAVIFDLNNASDLKNYSIFLCKFKLVIWDEFLTLPFDYVLSEDIKLDLIKSTLDRNSSNPLFPHPKFIFLTNPVNFDSEVLASLDIFETLEKMSINSHQIVRNVFIEMLRNDSANEKKSKSLFPVNTSNLSGEFVFNTHNIKSNFQELSEKIPVVKVKLNDTQTLSILKDKFYILKIEFTKGDENACINIKDKTKKVEFLTEKFYSDKFYKKYEKDLIFFGNSFTKNEILKNYQDLNIPKIYSYFTKSSKPQEPNFDEVIKSNLQKRFSFYDWF